MVCTRCVQNIYAEIEGDLPLAHLCRSLRPVTFHYPCALMQMPSAHHTFHEERQTDAHDITHDAVGMPIAPGTGPLIIRPDGQRMEACPDRCFLETSQNPHHAITCCAMQLLFPEPALSSIQRY